MSAPKAEIYCLLVPISEERLLVPRGCITEVINYVVPTPMEGAPPWYLGTIPWNGTRLPLVSFEAACGRNLPRSTGRTLIVVMQGITGLMDGGHFALLTQGFPQLVRVSPEVLHLDDSRVFEEPCPVTCQLRMASEYPLIPEFELLEAMIAEETRVA